VSVRIVVNGEEQAVPDGSTIASLLDSLQLASARVAVEHNRQVLRKDEHPSVRLHDGDRVEIVHFVGGG
jgi:sulfur carrier protein